MVVGVCGGGWVEWDGGVGGVSGVCGVCVCVVVVVAVVVDLMHQRCLGRYHCTRTQ